MVAGKRRELAFPLSWFSTGNRFRYERPQKGRLREFYHTDIDLVGLPEGEADLEILTIASELLKAFGAKESDFSIRINSRALLIAACKAAGFNDKEGMREYWRFLDKKSKMSAKEFEKERGGDADPLSLIESDDSRIKDEKEKVMKMLETLKTRGIKNVVFDPEIVRGFDYYTALIFEIFDTNRENPRSLFGGGRYDELVALFGGDPIPAVGFAFGDVTLMDFLTTHGYEVKAPAPADVYVGTPGVDDLETARIFVDTLRLEGLHVFVNLTKKSLGDQVKDAAKRGIPYFIAFGKDETTSGMIRLKTLRSGGEESILIKEVVKRVRAGEFGI